MGSLNKEIVEKKQQNNQEFEEYLSVLTDSASHSQEDRIVYDAIAERQKRGWGHKYEPPVSVSEDFRKFMSLRNDLARVVDRLDQFVEGDSVSEDASTVVAEIEAILEEFYECKYGKGEALKQFVLTVLGQTRNSNITVRHVRFLKDVSQFLSSQMLIDDTAVDWLMEQTDSRGLDMFRGVLTDTGIVKRFKIVEVTSDAS